MADVTARTTALEHLADALADPTTGAAASDGPGARAELGPLAGGSAVAAAEALVRDLRGSWMTPGRLRGGGRIRVQTLKRNSMTSPSWAM